MNHIIRRQLLELTIDSKQQPFDLQNRLSDHYYQVLLPSIEKWLDQLSGEAEVVYIDKLVLDLGIFSSKEFDDQLLQERLTEQLHSPQVLQAAGSGEPGPGEAQNSGKRSSARTLRRITTRLNAFEQWLWYMEKGYLPWTLPKIDKEWETKVLETMATDYDSISRLRNLLAGQSKVLTRIVLQQDELFLTRLTEIFTTITQTSLPQVLRELRQLLDYGAGLRDCGLPDFPASAAGNYIMPSVPTSDNIWKNTLLLAASLGREGTTQQLFHRLLSFYWESLSDLLFRIHISDRQAADRSKSDTSASNKSTADPLTTMDLRLMLDRYLADHPAAKNLLAGYPGYSPATKPDHSSAMIPDDQPGASANRQAWTGTPRALSPADPNPGAAKDPTTDRPVSAAASINLLSSQNAPTPHTPERPADGHELPANSPVVPEEGLFIANAGVILTHPFLHHLFKKTGLVVNGKFVGGAARQKAIHLIHFMATGRTFSEEHELVIAKILCACPLEEPMGKQPDWSGEELPEADSLLQGLVSHWGVKGITPEGLRGNFLSRSGKLTPKPDKLHLIIEKHAVDILVRTFPFPWNMSIIKLPWLNQTIHLDW